MEALREAAQMLVAAERPVIVADKYARTAAGIKCLVALAEVLNAPVIDQRGRMNIPNTHYLKQTSRAQGLVSEADVVLGLEVSDFWATVNRYIDNGDNDGVGLQESRIKPNARLISINSVQLNTKSNYQDFQRFQVVDVDMAGDAEATMPALIEAVKQALPSERKAAIEARGAGMKKAWSEARDAYPAGRLVRMGRQPNQYRAHDDGSLCADQGSRLVVGRRRPTTVELADQTVADGATLSPYRRTGRLWRWLQFAGSGRRRTRQPRRRTLLGQFPA